ncbi:hypothetical protein M5K25_022455 [Dendrobium thyrsiflorum]|uniref:Uncharacterized protein n=1 Tax=Dendrobium thyrsiflorum TaxID=117978 RepID=A0ABD0U680_DENTH
MLFTNIIALIVRQQGWTITESSHFHSPLLWTKPPLQGWWPKQPPPSSKPLRAATSITTAISTTTITTATIATAATAISTATITITTLAIATASTITTSTITVAATSIAITITTTAITVTGATFTPTVPSSVAIIGYMDLAKEREKLMLSRTNNARAMILLLVAIVVYGMVDEKLWMQQFGTVYGNVVPNWGIWTGGNLELSRGYTWHSPPSNKGIIDPRGIRFDLFHTEK